MSLSSVSRTKIGFSVGIKWFVASLVGLYVLALLLALVPINFPSLITVIPAVLALSFVPGTLVLLVFDELECNARSLLYALGLSLMVVMAVGFAINILLPLIGISQPLSLWCMGGSLGLVVAGLAHRIIQKRDGETLILEIPGQITPAPLAFALLPLLSILSISILNHSGDNRVLLAVLIVVAILPLVTVSFIDSRYYSFGIWTTALAVLYHKSLWQYAGFSGSPGVVRSYFLNRWTPGIQEIRPSSTQLLENGVLFPTFARFGDIHILTQMEVVNPFLVAFIPLCLFVAFRTYVSPQKALLGALVFLFAHPFYIQYPTAGRAGTPVLFLALFGVVLSDRGLPPTFEAILRITFVSGIIVSHYGTSYFVMFVFIGALVLLRFILRCERALFSRIQRSPVPDGGRLFGKTFWNPTKPGRETNFPLYLVLFFTAGVLAWYMYATQGSSFSLPRHIARSFTQLLEGDIGSGRTAARLQRNYGTPAVFYSKLLYIALAGLIGIGLLSEAYRRYFTSDGQWFDLEYDVVAVVMLATFSSTVLVRNWGGGRPMMITFVFTTIFAPVGVYTIFRSFRAVFGRIPIKPRLGGELSFSMFLMTLLLLNTGVASVLVLGGYAPSNVPAQPQMEESSDPGLRSSMYMESDISLHAWLIDHHESGFNAWSGRIVGGQTDWYLPAIIANANGLPDYGGWKPRGRVEEWSAPGIEPGYLMMGGHNTALGKVWGFSRFEPINTSEISTEFERRDRIYSNGHGAIYFSEQNTTLGDE